MTLSLTAKAGGMATVSIDIAMPTASPLDKIIRPRLYSGSDGSAVEFYADKKGTRCEEYLLQNRGCPRNCEQQVCLPVYHWPNTSRPGRWETNIRAASQETCHCCSRPSRVRGAHRSGHSLWRRTYESGLSATGVSGRSRLTRHKMGFGFSKRRKKSSVRQLDQGVEMQQLPALLFQRVSNSPEYYLFNEERDVMPTSSIVSSYGGKCGCNVITFRCRSSEHSLEAVRTSSSGIATKKRIRGYV